MASKPTTTKPAKPTITPVRVRSIIAAATAASLLTLCTAWGVLGLGWPKLVFDASLGFTLLSWVGVIAMAHARHVTLYVRDCATLNSKRHDQTLGMLRRANVVAVAESYLQEN